MALTFISRSAAYIRAVLGNQFIDQDAAVAAIRTLPMDVQDGITAHAGGGQAGAVPLILGNNRVTTVVTTGDSVLAPTASAGQDFILVNDGANTLHVFASPVLNPVTGALDTIDGVANATGNTVTAGHRVQFFTCADGNWLTTASVAST